MNTPQSQRARRVAQQHSRKSARKKISTQQKKNKKDSWHWSLSFLVISWFIGIPFIVYHAGGKTMIDVPTVFLIILSCGVISLLIQVPIFSALRKKKGGERFLIGKSLFVIYNIFGCGIAMTALFLQLNFSFRANDPVPQDFKIIGIDENYRVGSYTGIVYLLEEGKLDDYPDFRWFKIQANPIRTKKPFIRLNMHEGLFGFTVVGDRFLVDGPSDSTPAPMPYL